MVHAEVHTCHPAVLSVSKHRGPISTVGGKTLQSGGQGGWSASRAAGVVQTASTSLGMRPQHNIFCPRHRGPTPLTLYKTNSYTKMELHTQGQVLTSGWTSTAQQSRAAASSSGRGEAKTACETLEMDH